MYCAGKAPQTSAKSRKSHDCLYVFVYVSHKTFHNEYTLNGLEKHLPDCGTHILHTCTVYYVMLICMHVYFPRSNFSDACTIYILHEMLVSIRLVTQRLKTFSPKTFIYMKIDSRKIFCHQCSRVCKRSTTHRVPVCIVKQWIHFCQHSAVHEYFACKIFTTISHATHNSRLLNFLYLNL